jgi:hypothetical protein
MPLIRVLPFYMLLLAACSTPPDTTALDGDFDAGPDCQNACAAGYRWALEEEHTDPVKCRGEEEFARGCRKAVEFQRPFDS